MRARVADRHEWWVATDFAGGRHGDALEPRGDVAGWVACCECGWHGRPYARVRSSEEENRAARRVYSEGRLEPSWVLNDMCHEWLAHLNRRTAA